MREFALMVLAMWLLVPVFLILLHLFIGFWRRVGRSTYLILLSLWVPMVFGVYLEGKLLLQGSFMMPFFIQVAGIALLASGVGLHVWTAWLLGLRATIGLAELDPVRIKRSLVVSGPFAVIRHPTYLAHSLMLLGAFLLSGYYAVGLLILLDLSLAYLVTIPLEERELLKRFDGEYERYKKLVPALFPISR